MTRLWTFVSALLLLTGFSIALPLFVALVRPEWHVLDGTEQVWFVAVVSSLYLGLAAVAARRARLLDAEQRLRDANRGPMMPELMFASEAVRDRFYRNLMVQDREDELFLGPPLSSEQWRSLEQIAKS